MQWFRLLRYHSTILANKVGGADVLRIGSREGRVPRVAEIVTGGAPRKEKIVTGRGARGGMVIVTAVEAAGKR